MIIRYDGFKLFPIQIEKVVDSSDEIDCSCVVGVNDSEHSSGKLPMVFIVKTKTSKKSNNEIIAELKETCIAKLPEYSIPNSFRFIESLPLTLIGKVDYSSLEIIAEE